MKRIDWLRTFLELADSNAPAIEYRKRLRLMTRQLPAHVASIPKYREELATLEAEAAEAAKPKTIGSTLESFMKEEGLLDDEDTAGTSKKTKKSSTKKPRDVGLSDTSKSTSKKSKSSKKLDGDDELGHSNYRG